MAAVTIGITVLQALVGAQTAVDIFASKLQLKQLVDYIVELLPYLLLQSQRRNDLASTFSAITYYNHLSLKLLSSSPQQPPKSENIVVDPSCLLDEETAYKLIEILPGSGSFCLWKNGELQYQSDQNEVPEQSLKNLPITSTNGRLRISKFNYEINGADVEVSPKSPAKSTRKKSTSFENRVKVQGENRANNIGLFFNKAGMTSPTQISGSKKRSLSWPSRDGVFKSPDSIYSKEGLEPNSHLTKTLAQTYRSRSRSTDRSVALMEVPGVVRTSPNQQSDSTVSVVTADALTNGYIALKEQVAPNNMLNAEQEDQIQVLPQGPPTPPPAAPPAQPQRTSTPMAERIDVPRLNNRSLVQIGTKISTAGVKLRRKNETQQYLTISTHAAFDGVNEKPLPVGKLKTGVFKKAPKAPCSIDKVVVDQVLPGNSTQNREIGHIRRFTSEAWDDCRCADDRCPIFPNDFQHNISFVGPLTEPVLRLSNDRSGLKWCYNTRLDGVRIRILGHESEGMSFVPVGAMYARNRNMTKKPFEVERDVIQRSVLFIRDDAPFEEGHNYSGAPVVAASLSVVENTKGEVVKREKFDQLLGFNAFQFTPSNGQAENLAMVSRNSQQLQNRYKKGDLTICGALIPSDDFKDEWLIVPDGE